MKAQVRAVRRHQHDSCASATEGRERCPEGRVSEASWSGVRRVVWCKGRAPVSEVCPPRPASSPGAPPLGKPVITRVVMVAPRTVIDAAAATPPAPTSTGPASPSRSTPPATRLSRPRASSPPAPASPGEPSLVPASLMPNRRRRISPRVVNRALPRHNARGEASQLSTSIPCANDQSAHSDAAVSRVHSARGIGRVIRVSLSCGAVAAGRCASCRLSWWLAERGRFVLGYTRHGRAPVAVLVISR